VALRPSIPHCHLRVHLSEELAEVDAQHSKDSGTSTARHVVICIQPTSPSTAAASAVATRTIDIHVVTAGLTDPANMSCDVLAPFRGRHAVYPEITGNNIEAARWRRRSKVEWITPS
jgi:hypothetical protein